MHRAPPQRQARPRQLHHSSGMYASTMANDRPFSSLHYARPGRRLGLKLSTKRESYTTDHSDPCRLCAIRSGFIFLLNDGLFEVNGCNQGCLFKNSLLRKSPKRMRYHRSSRIPRHFLSPEFRLFSIKVEFFNTHRSMRSRACRRGGMHRKERPALEKLNLIVSLPALKHEMR